MLPPVGTCTEAHPAGDHMYSLPFPVHSAKRGRLGSHWKQRTADVCSSTASKLIFCRSHTHTAVAMLSAGRDREGELRWQEFTSFRWRTCSDLPFLVARYRLSELNTIRETPILGFARSGSGLTTGSWTGGGDSSSGAARYKLDVKNHFVFKSRRTLQN